MLWRYKAISTRVFVGIHPVPCFHLRIPAMDRDRKKQIIAGGFVIGAVGFILSLLWLGRFLPGEAGKVFEMMVGLIMSPFLMPVFFVFVGFTVVNLINGWRRQREGDEFVHMEAVQGPESLQLRAEQRAVIYREEPLAGEDPEPVALLEGAVAIRDLQGAKDILSAMDQEALALPKVIRSRILLAEASGNPELAAKLRSQLPASED